MEDAMLQTKDTAQAQKEKRLEMLASVTASDALEGIKPLVPEDGVPYRLMQDWLDGKITAKQQTMLLKKHYRLS